MIKFDLDERMINFSVLVIKLSEKLPKSTSGVYYSDQIIRSVSSSVLNYSEAQSAESRKDFIHKIKLALKELRETYSALRILSRLELLEKQELEDILRENNELISILVKSIKTARKNMIQN